ncbi:universal stress protein [Deinococcus sp.]|uniref:universal stress protein n=1 Tax=Deinococcus sp. TaxID=47478 RepID=UPI0025DC7022|nr:universal stress protein [Deinococcus sp.]
MFERILVLTDGSPCAALALPYAADLTRTYHSQLTVLYVMPDLLSPLASAEGLAYTYNSEQERTQALDEGTRILEQARVLLDVPGANLVRLEAQRQSVAEVVADQVERLGTELVVMSTHGRSGLAHLFLGSVAEQVLRRVRVPVFLLSAAQHSPAPGAQRQAEH